MEGFFFALKTFIFSVFVLFVLQLRVGGNTLEERSERLIYQSAASQTLSGVARGAIRLSKEAWRATSAVLTGAREGEHDRD